MSLSLDYELLDSGQFLKLERFGPYRLIRPCSQAFWKPSKKNIWKSAHSTFSREGKMRWQRHQSMQDQWEISMEGMRFSLRATDFGHLGIFPEQMDTWRWLKANLRHHGLSEKPRILNLFAYSGGSTLACAQVGAAVCHVDASKGMVNWARENAALNALQKAPVRWIVDDVQKFLLREIRKNKRYDGIILDPPTYGRGSRGEVFKLENDLHPLLESCRKLLSETPLFFHFSCHTPGYTPQALRNLFKQYFAWDKNTQAGELCLEGDKDVFPLPSGSYFRWGLHA